MRDLLVPAVMLAAIATMFLVARVRGRRATRDLANRTQPTPAAPARRRGLAVTAALAVAAILLSAGIVVAAAVTAFVVVTSW